MLSPSSSANLTNSNLIATTDPPILGIAFLLHRGVNDQSDQVLTISPVHTILRERRPAASRPVGEGSGREIHVRGSRCMRAASPSFLLDPFLCHSRAKRRIPDLSLPRRC